MSADSKQFVLDIPLNPEKLRDQAAIVREIAAFAEFGKPSQSVLTTVNTFDGQAIEVPTFINEFWTARRRQAHSIHEISYRACFKPQLPAFFIERLTKPGGVVYDPFLGRGTTAVEAALHGRIPFGCDVSPLSEILTQPRLQPPSLEAVAERLEQIDFLRAWEWPEELLVFYHPETLRRIVALKEYLLERVRLGQLDAVDNWIRMVAINRLTGHSNGFFSVYTLPPNQAVSVKSQQKINERRNQKPPARDIVKIILKKSKSLLKDLNASHRRQLDTVAAQARLLTQSCTATPEIADGSVDLIVTSPPFLDVVQYADDNWLRCWFIGLDAKQVLITAPRKLEDWQTAMTESFREIRRILKPGGYAAFEVGEVHGGKTKLEEAALPCGIAAGLHPELILINAQEFTKTANCWGVDNNAKGTNSNRIILFRKP